LAAIAVPQYQHYVNKGKTKASVAAAYQMGQDATHKIGLYYVAHDGLPPNLAAAGVHFMGGQGVKRMQLDAESGRLEVETLGHGTDAEATLAFTPSLDDNQRVVWRCEPDNVAPEDVPAGCR